MAEQNERTDPMAARDAHYRRADDFKDQTHKQVDERRRKIEELKERRQELRLAAANSAGLIGLQYLADSNSYVHLVSGTEDALIRPEIADRPDPLAPDEVPALSPALEGPPPVDEPRSEPKKGFTHWFGEAFLWLLVLPIGAFVGVGLATLAGFAWQRNAEVILPIAIFFGVAVVAGLKLMLSHLWLQVGRAAALGKKIWGMAALAGLLTVAGCGIDAHLGAMALRQFSLGRSFREEDAITYWQCLLLALALTTPLLIASSIKAYRQGQKEPTDEERRRARADREYARWEQRRQAEELEEAKRRQQRELDRQRHRQDQAARTMAEYEDRKGLTQLEYDERKRLEKQREEDWAELRQHPEFKCLQGLIGQIGVLNHEIAEREKELTSFKIGRGYEKAYEFPNGKPSPAPKAPVEEAPAEGEGEVYVS